MVSASKCSAIYVGCYADVINSLKRDLSGLGQTLINTQGGGSIEACVDHCSMRGFTYAGVQIG